MLLIGQKAGRCLQSIELYNVSSSQLCDYEYIPADCCSAQLVERAVVRNAEDRIVCCQIFKFYMNNGIICDEAHCVDAYELLSDTINTNKIGFELMLSWILFS